MSFVLAIEALKFYKLKQERLVQAMFLLCFAINAAGLLFPIGNTDFSNLNAWLTRNMTLDLSGLNNQVSYPPALSNGNLLFLASQAVILLINIFFSYFYAAAYSAERDGLPASKGIKTMARSLPKQFLLLLLIIVPAFLGIFMFLIPVLIGSFIILFTPMLIAERRMKLNTAISDSYILTRHRKFYLFLSFVLVNMFINLLERLVLGIAGSNSLALVLLLAMVMAIAAMMRGRLIGLTYVFFAKQLRYLSLQQFFSKNPQDAMKALLGRDENEKDGKSDQSD